MTVKQVAGLIQVSTDTVYRPATGGALQGRRVGRAWRFPSQSVQAFLLRSRQDDGASEPCE